jgi:F0F1-type ATP synthase assembly protein I
MDQGMSALSYLISGVLLWGGLGWLGDHFLGWGFLLPIGIVVGAGFGCYMIIARFGGLPTRTTSSTEPAPAETRAAGAAATDERHAARGEESL